MTSSSSDQNQSQPALRRMIGYVALTLPLILGFGHFPHSNVSMQPSISHFYYIPILGDIMVGALCAVGGFLILYQGYEVTDRRWTSAAGAASIGIALFPTDNDPGLFADGWTRVLVSIEGAELSNSVSYGALIFEYTALIPHLHIFSALVFFVCLAWVAIVEFTKTSDPANMSDAKRARNRIYRLVGGILVVVLVLLVGRTLFAPDWAPWDAYFATFFIEAIGIMAFGFAWLIKGEAMMCD